MRAWVAALLAFGPLLISQPAQANWQSNNALVQGDTVQFSYMWGFAEQSFTDATVSVTVTNDITNKIGYGGEVIDTYRIILGNQVIEKTEKHGPITYTFEIIGTQTLRLEGIDRGFWAGFYGPIMQVSVVIPEPTPTESPSVSDTISESVTVAPEITQSADLTQSPVVEPTPTPSPEPAPSPEPVQPQPTPTVEPSPEPTVSSTTESPSPEPTQSPTVVDESPTQSAEPAVPPVLPSISPTALPLPTIFPSPAQSIEETYEEPTIPATEAPQVTEETKSDSVSGTVQTAVAEAIGAAVKAMEELVNTVTSAGLDLTPQQREKAQDVVVSAVIVSQVASAASVTARKIK
jgi:hypothetical protein